MTLTGKVTMPKELMHHEFLNREPRCKKAAFTDLWFMANDTARCASVRGIEVPLKRGQFARALLSLAELWRWNKDKVKAFLVELQDERLITFETSNTVTIITVLDYTVYNADSAANQDAESPTEPDAETSTVPPTNPLRNREVGIGIRNGNGCSAPPQASETIIPNDEEVETFCANYSGDLARGIPPVIPYAWWNSWLAWQLKDPETFPRDWKRALLLKFRADFLRHEPSALGQLKKNAPNFNRGVAESRGGNGEVSASVMAIGQQKKIADLRRELSELQSHRQHERDNDLEPDAEKKRRLGEVERALEIASRIQADNQPTEKAA